MYQRFVMHNGRRYVVNAVGWDDSGVGSGAPPGQQWMQSDDGNWYPVALTGTSASIAISVGQAPLGWIDPGGQAFGYQLLKNPTDGLTYKVTLSGSAGSVTIQVEPDPWPNTNDGKPYLTLRSPVDTYFYPVGLTGSAPPVLYVNPNAGLNSKLNY